LEQDELDEILQVVENPVRRKIIKRLSQAPSYALQLSKELGLGQPLVAKHLAVMQDRGIVTSTEEKKSTKHGPRRTWYSLAKSVSITMDLAPNLFIERGVAFESGHPKPKASQEASELRRKVQDAMEERDERERLSRISEALSDIDERMNAIEDERVELLKVRNQAMQEAAGIAAKLDELDKRRVLFHILDQHDMEVESISESLNLREFAVRAILEDLEREYFG
jgi:predicted transcriptional regulator